MSLETEIEKARKKVVTDGYDMSIGEIISLYRDKEIIINPEYQRLFRWEDSKKTKFVESILLGIPIPPIFVSQMADGKFELVDGLQRISTIMEFVGILERANGKEKYPPFQLEGTKLLPSLNGKYFNGSDEENSFTDSQKIEFRRARMRLEILKKDSDKVTKYELFQRLNTGGEPLTEQEVRKCTLIMISKKFHDWLDDLAKNKDFVNSIDITEKKTQELFNMELALRFFAFRNVKYTKGLDVHEYVNSAMISMAEDKKFDFEGEAEVFIETFKMLNRSVGSNAFRRWDGHRFIGGFMSSAFEVFSVGISKNWEGVKSNSKTNDYIKNEIKEIWKNKNFKKIGAGVRGSERLAVTLALSEKSFDD